MRKLIFLILLIPVFAFAQLKVNVEVTVSGSDTVSNITAQDTLQWRLGNVDGWTSWNTVTNYITAAEKTAETVLHYSLADESGWAHALRLDLQIKSSDADISCSDINIGHTSGAISVWIKPDTLLETTPADTSTLYNVWVTGL